ncbi:hypothetical protein PTSG_03178 [Salpingoeca rosetta]|uniref:DNA 3'-5' helicase n=1 Tax=Salpingoeca rosetta (strain ATCC 50818 / BSB-021) TaxID=946362 RepID=F2U4G2_SALR5|nr:uncharacterized protein PTSG_03178 [Salpingoeca rosetta]EGD82528.1 hypothetical protein PTSG_03178 [Salpingoeca rosetta]|eukprot:XP_004995764.1 hypothetical protein PTSG_03178 [Salpingoeca rosetta]
MSSAKSKTKVKVKKEVKLEEDEAIDWAEDDGEAEDFEELQRREEAVAPHDEDGAIDMSHMQLKPDHEVRPIIVTPDKRIFLETFSPVYQQAVEFLIAIAEPERRPESIHEYRMTRDSLYAAASLGLGADHIIEVLHRLSKTSIPAVVCEYVRHYTSRYGKVTLFLEKNRYFLESSDPSVLQTLLRDPEIQSGRVMQVEGEGADADGGLITKQVPSVDPTKIAGLRPAGQAKPSSAEGGDEELTDAAILAATERAELEAALPEDLRMLLSNIEGDVEKEDDVDRVSFEIKRSSVQTIQKRLLKDLEYPLLLEYDYTHDPSIPRLDIDLKPTCRLRPYQEKSLRKMFNHGRARSGIIVLPCGAGKTLTGVTAVSTIKRRAIVLCTSNVAVEQWRREFVRWCDVDHRVVRKFTSADKHMPPDNCILCATYSMLAAKQNRSVEAKQMIEWITGRSWGIMILDEVQTVPAKTFRELLTRIPAHCKLGLTATLVREDGKINDLRFMVGPKLYEANWIDLQEAGYIARVKCFEVWCPMVQSFYEQYWRTDSHAQKMKLCVCNPNKFSACEFLIRKHEARGDKIIVFSDDIFALHELATKLNKEYISGDTPDRQRHEILDRYKKRDDFRTIFFSKIADNAFDLPEANVLIQVSSQGGARRQEAQRLGRILRAKSNTKTRPGEPNAFFYSLVSRDTKEMAYATARQRFLVDQGYAFQVLTRLVGFEEEAKVTPFVFDSPAEQKQLLIKIAESSSMIEEARNAANAAKKAKRAGKSVVQRASMDAFAGAGDMVYEERRVRKKKPLRKLLFGRRK